MSGIDNNTLLYLRGDSFNDLSLSPKTITNNGLTVLDNGDFSKSLDFTGTKNATVTLPTFLGEPFTVEWYEYNTKKGASGQYCSVFTNVIKPATTSGNNNYGFGIGTNALTSGEPSISLSTNITSSWDICQDKPIGNCVLNKWVHRCIVYNGTSVISYENGKKYMEFNLGGKKILNTYNTFQFNRWRELNYSSFRYIRSFRVSNIARYTGDFTPHSCTYAYNSININVTNKDFTKADFNVSKLGQETINKVEIIQNDKVKETFTDSYDNLTFNHKGKAFKIVVTYDDNYTEEQEIHIGNSKAKIYLYKEGNECISLTGGWKDLLLRSQGGTITRSREGNSLYVNANINVNYPTNGGFVTSDRIDFSNYNKLYFDYKHTRTKDDFPAYHSLGVLTNTSTNNNDIPSRFSVRITPEKNDRKLTSIDVLDLVPNFVAVATGGNYTTSEIYLYNTYLETKENVISINSQNTSSINFSCNNLDNLITITKAEVYINNQLSKAYNDNFDNITYNIDKNLCIIGVNNIKIKVTYSQGDDIYETVEENLVHTNTVNPLSEYSSLTAIIERVKLLTNTKEIEKNILKSILESKNVEVSEEENKLSILIQKVNELEDAIPPIVYLYNEGDECEDITGGWSDTNVSIGTYYSKRCSVVKNNDHMLLNVNKGLYGTSVICTVNKIDISKYSMLHIEYECVSKNTATGARAANFGTKQSLTDITSTNIPATESATSIYEAILNTKTNGSIDISNLTNSYVCAYCLQGNDPASNGNMTFKIYKIWLER